jgi:L-aspartate oxidase
MCRSIGLDLARDPIPVGPAAHYMMGGVDTDDRGRTSLPGLFAAGEVACTGLHGANRLASNSLLEGLVFGARAADAMTQPAAAAPLQRDRAFRPTEAGLKAASPQPSALSPDRLRALMWRSVGLFRERDGLVAAASALGQAAASTFPTSIDGWRHRNLATVASLVANAALRREESRGGHFRSDFPNRDDIHWRVHVVDQKDHG